MNDGNGGANYAVTFANDTTGVITVRAITVTAAAASKPYDGTISSAVSPAVTSGTIAAGDTAAFTQSYDNRNAGTGKLLTPAGLVNDGNGGANYTVALTAANVGAITPLPIAVIAAADSKIYDGTTGSSGVPTVTTGNLIAGDITSFTQTFDTKDVGTEQAFDAGGSGQRR